MAQRTALAEIQANKRPNQELSPGRRRQLYGRFLAAQSLAEISAEEQLPKSTITTTLQKVINRSTARTKARSGRRKAYSSCNERRIVLLARRHPKWTYRCIRDETGRTLCNKTIYKMVDDHGIIHWRYKKRPHLSDHYARLRLQFAQDMRNIDWSRVIFSHECSVDKGKGKKQQWAFGYLSEKWSHERI